MAYLTSNDDSPACDRLLIQQSESGATVEIPRLDLSTAYRTLRAWIAADGSQQRQLEVLQTHAAIWTEAIKSSSLSKADKQVAFLAFLKPQIAYPLGCSAIEETDFKQLFRPVLDILLHTLGLNRISHWH